MTDYSSGWRHTLLLMYSIFFFLNATATTEIYTGKDTLSLHDALPISRAFVPCQPTPASVPSAIRTPRRIASRSEEHTSELQSPFLTSYAVFCLKQKKRCSFASSLFPHRMFYIASIF